MNAHMRYFSALAGFILLAGSSLQGSPNQIRAELTEEGFPIPSPQTELTFPRAHGSHPAYKIEWWYLTGQMDTAEGRAFGYQATFFRTAAPLEGTRGDRYFGDRQFYMAHMALTDISDGRFYHEERLNRDGWDASASVEGMDVRNGNWHLVMLNPDTEEMELHFTLQDNVRVHLNLEPTKPLIRFGEDGVSRKGPHPAATSYYLSFTNLKTRGTVHLNGTEFTVEGRSWMDHEIASRQLSTGLEGWDWTAIQLEDGREIKAYILRREDGSADAYSRIMWIDADARVQSFGPSAFRWERTRWWRSPQSGTRYPIEVTIHTTDPDSGNPLALKLKPLLDAQEISGDVGGIPYWEGACLVINGETGEPLGRAYLELAGYAESLGDRLR